MLVCAHQTVTQLLGGDEIENMSTFSFSEKRKKRPFSEDNDDHIDKQKEIYNK